MKKFIDSRSIGTAALLLVGTICLQGAALANGSERNYLLAALDAQPAPAADTAAQDKPAAAAAQPGTSSETREWKFEVTPYLWAAGIDADITVNGHTDSVSQSFSDLVDKVDFGGGILGSAQCGKWVSFMQLDYIALKADLNSPAGGTFKSNFSLITAGAGYQFPNQLFSKWWPGSTIDVMVGVRYLNIDNTLDLNGVGSFSKTMTAVDPALILRPKIPLSEKWMFSPTMSIGGGGDSDLVYELAPSFLYSFSDAFGVRLGYRTVHYKIPGDNGNEFDGGLSGLLIGASFNF